MMVPRSYLLSTVARDAVEAEKRQRRPQLSPTRIIQSPRHKSLPSLPVRQVELPPKTEQCQVTVQPAVETRPSPQPLQCIVPIARRTTQSLSIPTSQPMIIPPRRPSNSKNSASHDPNAIPPAVAALLAVTSIPRPRGRTFQRLRGNPSKRVSMEDLRQEWRKDVSGSSSLGRGSPLDFLLEPAEGTEGEDSTAAAEEEGDKEESSMSSRSVSSESIASALSLFDATSSSSSTWTSTFTPTPSVVGRSLRPERRERVVSSPPTQECLDHPLQTPPTSEEFPYSSFDANVISPSAAVAVRRDIKSKSTFKSNLTASLQALRTAAKSFSNFTAPSIPSDDLLTRSLFSSRFASEMRPKGFSGVPDPALRRYLNPTPAHHHHHHHSLSSPDFSLRLQEALAAQDRPSAGLEDPPAPMIQMQTYVRSPRGGLRRVPTRSASAGAERLEFPAVGNSLSLPPTARQQREPRENSDFLRVIVLEMNMRRVGKLDAKAGGRARVWLPPRKNPEASEPVNGGVPERWLAVSAEDLQ